MHVIFGTVTERQMPARDERPAYTTFEQKAWLVAPGRDGEPDTSVPFQVNHRDPADAYLQREPYGLTASHFTVSRFGKIEFNPYGRFELIEAQPASQQTPLKLSQQAAVPGTPGHKAA